VSRPLGKKDGYGIANYQPCIWRFVGQEGAGYEFVARLWDVYEADFDCPEHPDKVKP